MHRGITVVDIPGGAILWFEPFWTLDSVAGDRVTVLCDSFGQGMMVVDAARETCLRDAEDPCHPGGSIRARDESVADGAFPDRLVSKNCSAHRLVAPFTRGMPQDHRRGEVWIAHPCSCGSPVPGWAPWYFRTRPF